MPRASNKHKNAQRIFYPSFDGGLNLSVPPESLGRNELKEALNVEFSPSTGAMTVRGGLVWSGRFDKEIDSVVPVAGRNGFLVRHKGERILEYFRWNNIWPVNGTLTGDGDLSVVSWDDEYLVASGGKLQRFTDKELPSLSVIPEAPDNCRMVFVRNGRIGVVSGEDTLKFSAVGDCTSWNNNPNDESSGQFIEIGYKDGMNIDAVMPLSRDLIIFKSPVKEPDKGIIWRLTGDYPNWSALEAAHNTGTFSCKSVQAVGNDVYYVTVSGVASLSSVTSYGEIQAHWPDRKVSPSLTPLLRKTAELWNVPAKQQIWIKPYKESQEIWVFDYSRGIWTKFEFPKTVIQASGIDNALYVFIGRDLYRVQDGYSLDELKDGEKERITARMKMGTLLTGKQLLIKGAFVSFGILPGCEAELRLGKFKMKFTGGGTPDYIHDAPNDTQKASEDTDPLFPTVGTLTSRRRCLVRDWSITPEILIYGGGCSLSTMGLEIVEV